MKILRDVIIALVFGHEKGFVNRPKTDRGGATNHGITIRTLGAWRGHPVTVNDVRLLTQKEAYDIYAENYWKPIRGDDLPAGLDYCLFDSCVTSGPNRAVRILQEVLLANGAKNGDGTPLNVDGNIGANTINAVGQFGVDRLINDYNRARLDFMKSIGGPQGFSSNGRGWTIRVTGKDPKGQWAFDENNVTTVALKLYKQYRVADKVRPNEPPAVAAVTTTPLYAPQELSEQATAKTDESAISLATILKKPEALTGGIASATAVLTAVSANTILSYAAAVVIVIGALIAGYYFVRRIRSANA